LKKENKKYERFIQGTDCKSAPAGEFSQTTNMITLGIPGLNLQYENDYMFGFSMPGVPKADGGDRYRTAAVRINAGVFSIGLNMFTGDPGLDNRAEDYRWIDGRWRRVYVESNGNNPNSHRAGVLYIGVGPFRFGRNSERIRHIFQNRLAHGNKYPWFEVLPRKRRWYWGFSTGTGNSLW
jgi:hypothetical protein